jgi:hypothetical protein
VKKQGSGKPVRQRTPARAAPENREERELAGNAAGLIRPFGFKVESPRKQRISISKRIDYPPRGRVLSFDALLSKLAQDAPG